MIDRLGIIDFRNIIRAVRETRGIDFSDYALTSFKRRLERIIQLHSLNGANELIAKIKEEQDFFEVFLKDISVEDTEMFRDPSLWRELQENIFPKIITRIDFRIWLPTVTSGEELYSLAIILKELSLLEKVKIIATSISCRNIEFIKNGVYDLKKMEVNIANYNRLKGQYKLSDYYTVNNNKAYLDTSLLKDVEFLQHNISEDKAPSKIQFILYRDKMVYFNLPMQNRISDILYNCLMPGGHFVVGVKESLESYNSDKKFIEVNKTENIYKKAVT